MTTLPFVSRVVCGSSGASFLASGVAADFGIVAVSAHSVQQDAAARQRGSQDDRQDDSFHGLFSFIA